MQEVENAQSMGLGWRKCLYGMIVTVLSRNDKRYRWFAGRGRDGCGGDLDIVAVEGHGPFITDSDEGNALRSCRPNLWT